MADLLIRDLDADAHRELKRRADRAGRSLQKYVAEVLEAHAARLPLRDWLAALNELESIAEVSGSDAVAQARDELP